MSLPLILFTFFARPVQLHNLLAARGGPPLLSSLFVIGPVLSFRLSTIRLVLLRRFRFSFCFLMRGWLCGHQPFFCSFRYNDNRFLTARLDVSASVRIFPRDSNESLGVNYTTPIYGRLPGLRLDVMNRSQPIRSLEIQSEWKGVSIQPKRSGVCAGG
jgi:hypothetical protein